ncbi:Uncharacterised protein [Salmonella enterica subsp. arizonae]|uniref:Uncharacterized protein n=1 Tax=Salmonella enterica subsp. arizonae TaxID=59203 RepID=A0A379T8I0_SALER|nr:Uncharacterised protein [Salmonella enterica subsp. arizonae]
MYALRLDAKILKILTCSYQYQLDDIVGDIMPAESDNAEKVRQIMRMYAEQYRHVYERSGYFYKAYMSLHKCVENLLPYSFRAGGNISFHLLLQALFFDGKYNNAALIRETIPTEPPAPITMKPDAFFNSILSLNLSQVKLFGDVISALLFHFPTIFYQYPKLRDEINQCIEKRAVTGIRCCQTHIMPGEHAISDCTACNAKRCNVGRNNTSTCRKRYQLCRYPYRLNYIR